MSLELYEFARLEHRSTDTFGLKRFLPFLELSAMQRAPQSSAGLKSLPDTDEGNGATIARHGGRIGAPAGAVPDASPRGPVVEL